MGVTLVAVLIRAKERRLAGGRCLRHRAAQRHGKDQKQCKHLFQHTKIPFFRYGVFAGLRSTSIHTDDSALENLSANFCHICNNFYCVMCDQVAYTTDTRNVQKTHIHFRSMFRICT